MSNFPFTDEKPEERFEEVIVPPKEVPEKPEKEDFYPIESDVPPPVLPPMPFDKMQVGQSFKVDLPLPRNKSAVRQRIVRWQKENPGCRMTMVAIDENTVRVWRVA